MKYQILLVLLFLSKSSIFSQTTSNDSMVTVVYIHKLKVDYYVKVGKNMPVYNSEKLYLIDTLKFNPANYVFCNGLKRDYQKGEILFLLEKRGFYRFLDRLLYKKKKLSKLFVDEEFKRKLLDYGINLDEIDPKLIVNNSL